MDSIFIGTINAFAFNFCPVDWLPCTGGTYSVQQYPALYALLGNTFGGTGSSSFGVPNLQGLQILGCGTETDHNQGFNYTWGETGGSPNFTLSPASMANHSHQVAVAIAANNAAGNVAGPANAYPALSVASGRTSNYMYASAATTPANLVGPSVSLAPTGQASPTAVQMLRPYTAVYYCIAAYGTFPIRP